MPESSREDWTWASDIERGILQSVARNPWPQHQCQEAPGRTGHGHQKSKGGCFSQLHGTHGPNISARRLQVEFFSQLHGTHGSNISARRPQGGLAMGIRNRKGDSSVSCTAPIECQLKALNDCPGKCPGNTFGPLAGVCRLQSGRECPRVRQLKTFNGCPGKVFEPLASVCRLQSAPEYANLRLSTAAQGKRLPREVPRKG